MLIKLTRTVDRNIERHYNGLCGMKACPSRKPYNARHLRRLAAHGIIQILTLLFAGMTISAIGALSIFTAHAQSSSTAVERLAVIESKQSSVMQEEDRITRNLDEVRSELAAEREKRSELDSRVSTLQGVGMGLGSIVMVLQAASMLMGLKRKPTA